MPFMVIKGTFHVVGKRGTKPSGMQPDGDSVHFKPLKPSRLDDLDQPGRAYRLSAINSINLRIEAVDAPELHYQGRRQPSPFAEAARDFLVQWLGITGVNYKAPKGITVVPPANDATAGYILAKQLESNGRPVSWVFKGNPPDSDGAWIRLTPALAKRSLNHALLASGSAYSLFYDTLYFDLRKEMTRAASAAANAGAGVWQADPTKPVKANTLNAIENVSTVYPKLFRRLADYFGEGHSGLGEFAAWMDKKGENDSVWTLPEWNKTHFDNVVKVAAGKVSLTKSPNDLVFVSR